MWCVSLGTTHAARLTEATSLGHRWSPGAAKWMQPRV